MTHKFNANKPLQGMPQGIVRGAIGFTCTLCHCYGMRTALAIKHDCKQTKENFSRRAVDPGSPHEGYQYQLRKLKRRWQQVMIC